VDLVVGSWEGAGLLNCITVLFDKFKEEVHKRKRNSVKGGRSTRAKKKRKEGRVVTKV
jgi:hypothetical protein